MEGWVTLSILGLKEALQGVAVAVRTPEEITSQVSRLITVADETRSISLWPTLWAKTVVLGGPESDEEALQLLRLTLVAARMRHRSRDNMVASKEELGLIWTMTYDALTSPFSHRLAFQITRDAQGYVVVPIFTMVANDKTHELLQLKVWLPDSMSFKTGSGVYHSCEVPENELHASLVYFDSTQGFADGAGYLGPKHGGGLSQKTPMAEVTAAALAEVVHACRCEERERV